MQATAETAEAKTGAYYPAALAHIDACELDATAMTARIHITYIRQGSDLKPQSIQTRVLETGNLYDWDMTPETAAELLPKAGEFRVIDYDPLSATVPYICGWERDRILPDPEGNAIEQRAAWLKKHAIADRKPRICGTFQGAAVSLQYDPAADVNTISADPAVLPALAKQLADHLPHLDIYIDESAGDDHLTFAGAEGIGLQLAFATIIGKEVS